MFIRILYPIYDICRLFQTESLMTKTYQKASKSHITGEINQCMHHSRLQQYIPLDPWEVVDREAILNIYVDGWTAVATVHFVSFWSPEKNLKATQVRNATLVYIHTWKGQIAKETMPRGSKPKLDIFRKIGGGSHKKRPKNKTFSKQNKGSFGFQVLDTIDTYKFRRFFCVLVWGLLRLCRFFSDEMDGFGSFWSYLSLIVTHVFPLDKLHTTGELLRILITFLRILSSQGWRDPISWALPLTPPKWTNVP